MFTAFIRVLKSGWLGFWRNKWLSVAAAATMCLTIFVISSLLLVNVLIDSLTTDLENKIDISVYFNLNAPEERILEARSDLVKLKEVQSVEYISREEALDKFKERHTDNQVLMQSLQELDTNPLGASLSIKTQLSSQYESVVKFLSQDTYEDIIDKINYKENEAIIARLSSITQGIRQGGLIILVVLSFLAVLVTFNTIRLTIYSSHKEIKIMKLVGASNWFVRGPFIIEGAIYGIAAALISVLILYLLLWYLSPKITVYLPGTDLFYYYQSSFFLFLLLQLGIGIALGAVSSIVAVRRYLDV